MTARRQIISENLRRYLQWLMMKACSPKERLIPTSREINTLQARKPLSHGRSSGDAGLVTTLNDVAHSLCCRSSLMTPMLEEAVVTGSRIKQVSRDASRRL